MTIPLNYIFEGCHKTQDITRNTQLSVPRINLIACQTFCSGTEYFAIKVSEAVKNNI